MKYKVELTDTQLHIILRAVNLMMRTGLGQTSDLTEWLVTLGDTIKFDTSAEQDKHTLDCYRISREITRQVIEGVMNGCWMASSSITKPGTVEELETIYLALRHQEWLDSKPKYACDVRAEEPTQQGVEPVPKIERVE